jgi:hypothetical protein
MTTLHGLALLLSLFYRSSLCGVREMGNQRFHAFVIMVSDHVYSLDAIPDWRIPFEEVSHIEQFAFTKNIVVVCCGVGARIPLLLSSGLGQASILHRRCWYTSNSSVLHAVWQSAVSLWGTIKGV